MKIDDAGIVDTQPMQSNVLSGQQTQEQLKLETELHDICLSKNVDAQTYMTIKNILFSSRTEPLKELMGKIESIQRYTEGNHGMTCFSKGKWVRLKDILALLEKEMK